MRTVICLAVAWLLLVSPVYAQSGLLADEWISEAEMKQQSAFARRNSLLLKELSCKFRDGVENPGRSDVIFRAIFERVSPAVPWGWTFDANAPLVEAENRARAAGFEVASEDFFEISGVSWVRCKIWLRP